MIEFYISAIRDPPTPFLLPKAGLGCGLAVEGVVSMGLARQGNINSTTCGSDDSSGSRDQHTSLESPCLGRNISHWFRAVHGMKEGRSIRKPWDVKSGLSNTTESSLHSNKRH